MKNYVFSIITQRNRKYIVFIVVISIFSIFVVIKAAAPAAVIIEAESSQTSQSSSVVADATASGGSAMIFASNSSSTEFKGWEINPTNIGLAPFGTTCNSLPAYAGPEVIPAGSVITGRRFTFPVYLYSGTITITKSCFKPTSNGPYGIVTTWNPNAPDTKAAGQVTITDSEFDGSLMTNQTVAYSAAFMGVGILERNYIHDMGTGIAFYNTGTTYTANAINNYVEKLRAYGDGATTGSHNESFTVRDYATSSNPNRSMAVRGNYFKIDSGNDTGSLFIQPYGGFINNVTVENNYLLGGGYQLILEYNFNLYGANMKAINNRFTSTGYGAGYTSGGPGWAQWTENYKYDATKPDGRGAVINEL